MKEPGDPDARTKLEETLTSYVMDTFSYVETVKDFLDGICKWILMRETELIVLLDINERAVTLAQHKGKGFLGYMRRAFVPSVAERQKEELQKELAATLKTSLMGLEALVRFLDAVERLSVTSVHVFQEDNPVLLIPDEGSLDTVQDIITAAQRVCPLLMEFKRNNQEFFSPKLENVEVLAYQLDEYIKMVQRICGIMKKGPLNEFSSVKPVVDIDEEISKDDVQNMLHRVNLLQELRQDEAFRMVFLFQEEYCSSFMKCFSESQLRMQQFLSKLEDSAVQLDRMNMGARISSVAGSSVGAVGGVLSIIGLALIPVTAGVSLALTLTGVGLGITSGVNSAVTTATEIGVKRAQQKRASETFQKFMEDVAALQESVKEVIEQTHNGQEDISSGIALSQGLGSMATQAAVLVVSDVVASAGKVVAEEGSALRNVPRVASDLPDVGQAAARGLAMSRGARGGFIALNALFLGMDVFFIIKDSIHLAQGNETEVSKFIRARSALWRSELRSWEKIQELLEKGQPSFQKKQAILKTQFYPDEVC